MYRYPLTLPLLAFLTCSSPQLFAISPPPEVGKETMVVTAQHEATDVRYGGWDHRSPAGSAKGG
jgi:hypothetical protein